MILNTDQFFMSRFAISKEGNISKAIRFQCLRQKLFGPKKLMPPSMESPINSQGLIGNLPSITRKCKVSFQYPLKRRSC